MARLNEPPIVAASGTNTETVEAVKRRFLRQNRELAKTNSQQSIRIRNLETEGSRLLAENLSLREQVLQLQNALEAQSNNPSSEDIKTVKTRLEAKLSEFNSLIAELGQLQKIDGRPRCRSQTAATRRSPDERQWRSGLGLQEVENAMLPTIIEDKYFPRKTMNADELGGVLEDPDSQSPDLGPPPVSRFESESPIAFNPNRLSEEQMGDATEETEPVLSANFETRRKRRESGPNIRRVSIFESPPEESEDRPGKTVRTGAKRKFNVQEDEEKAGSQPETFRFTRKSTQSTDDTASGKDKRPQASERPILGSKPVNTDPIVSPKKQRSCAADKPDTKPLASSKPRGRPRLTITRKDAPDLPTLPMPEPVPVAEINLEHLPPKTPALEDVFSPPSTESSNARPEARDTPPPGNLSSSDQVGRPSRRARPQVSYKEPSLNTKMRRPGKEMVDAVQPSSDRRASVEPTIKTELNEMGSAWKSLPPAPARGQDEGPEVGSPLREKLVRKDGGQGAESIPEAPKLNSSAASDAISALISATSTAKRRVPTVEFIVDTAKPSSTNSSATASEEKDNLAVFDFTDSSPNDPPMSRPRVNLAKTSRGSRRHSSVPASAGTEERSLEPRTKSDRSLPSLHQRTGSGTGVKSASTTNLAGSTSNSKTILKDRKTGALPITGGNTDLKASADVTSTGNLRAERAASRRKSMML